MRFTWADGQVKKHHYKGIEIAIHTVHRQPGYIESDATHAGDVTCALQVAVMCILIMNLWHLGCGQEAHTAQGATQNAPHMYLVY